MEKMSETFQIALGMAKYNKPEAIRMFEEDLQNFPDNIAAYNNIGQCKLELAIEAKDEKMLKESIDILTKGIELIEGKGYSRPSTIDFTLERAKATKF